MVRILFLFLALIFSLNLVAQDFLLHGTVKDVSTNAPVSGAAIMLEPIHMLLVTEETGRFTIRKSLLKKISTLKITAVGFESQRMTILNFQNGQQIALQPHQTELADVVVRADGGNPYRSMSELDIKMRGISNSTEILRMVPGLFIGQHQGGGKAEQLFLRGFDEDHGTDISLHADGIPINMVSHAHGQGYADSHFLIPETIESTTFKKGPYDAEKGDLATSGFVDFHIADALSKNTVKLEGGQFHTYRALVMLNLLGRKEKDRGQSWYAASEYRYSDSYFDNPQHFKRFNFITKYKTPLSLHSQLTLTASTLYSSWYASGQIPDQAIEKKVVGFYGALDPNEGGVTSRTNLNAQLVSSPSENDLFKSQLYYSRNKFDLHTNFTFFLVDTANGDEIRQKEARNLYGYNGSYTHQTFLGDSKLTTSIGLNARLDQTLNTQLSHTKNRYTLINPIKLGDITEFSVSPYLNETFRINEKVTVNAGLRFDQFYYQYVNKLASDTTLKGLGTYRAKNNIVSPKLSIYYQATEKAELYLSIGKGFHSNDTRVVVAVNGLQTLPAAYATDLGFVLKPAPNLLINAALWYIYLQQEFVYGGDGGTVDFSGRTQRKGFDLSARYEPLRSVFLDIDLNYAHGRSLDDPAGHNFIPLAPVFSSTGGITYAHPRGFNGSLRYRYLSDRPGNQTNSLVAKGYFINDLVLNYTRRKFEIGFTANNIFGVKWKETQFDTVTRLKHEVTPVDGMAFTPGTRFAGKFSIAYFF